MVLNGLDLFKIRAKGGGGKLLATLHDVCHKLKLYFFPNFMGIEEPIT